MQPVRQDPVVQLDQNSVSARVDFTGRMGSARAAVLGFTATLVLQSASNVQEISHLTSSNRSVPVCLVPTGEWRRGTVSSVQRTITQTVVTTHSAHHVLNIPLQPRDLPHVVVNQATYWLTIPDVSRVLRTFTLLLGL